MDIPKALTLVFASFILLLAGTVFSVFMSNGSFAIQQSSQVAAVSGTGSGLVAHFAFDEGAGAAASDSSGNGNTATLNGNPTWVAGRVGNGALDFNGSNNAGVVLNITSYPMSACVWAYPKAMGSIDSIVKSSGLNIYHIGSDSNRIQLYNNAGMLNGGTGSFPLNSWTHICATIDSNNFGRLYKNGVEIVNGNLGQSYFYSSFSFGDNFTGSIDDVRIFNRVLSASEVGEIYALASGSSGTNTGTVSNPPVTTDTTAPVISQDGSSSITSSSASISWLTNEPADSLVEYGLTTGYGNSTSLDANLFTSHSVTLSSLTANTTYHYRIKSKDASGNTAISSDKTFTTIQASTGSTSQGTSVTVATCNQPEIQAAIDSAKDGDTINIPAGSCSWPTFLSWSDKNIKVIGAGIDKTVISISSSAFYIGATTKASFRVSGMTFTGTPVNRPGVIAIASTAAGNPIKGWRIDHVKLNFPVENAVTGIQILGMSWGVIDSSVFEGKGYVTIHVDSYTSADGWPPGPKGIGGVAWDWPLNLGSDEAVYVEDNVFNFTSDEVSAVNDLVYGGRIVIRHNVINHAFIQTHATRISDRGGLKYEIYDNKFTGSGFIWPALLRSGTGVIFNNTVSGYQSNGFIVDNQRTCMDMPGNYPRCDGTRSMDGNTPGEYGWPCLDQIGRGPGTLGNQPSEPLYSWNNTGAEISVHGDYEMCTPDSKPVLATHIKSTPHSNGQVDFVNSSSPKPGYVPYTYPHPLRTGDYNTTVDVTNNPPLPPAPPTTVVNPPVVDTTAPSVSITTPVSGATVKGSVQLAATASDNVGVLTVQFRIDGTNLGEELTTAPYSGTWNTVGISNGSHTLTAVAKDAAGNIKTSSAVTITVSNIITTTTSGGGTVSGSGSGTSGGSTSGGSTGTTITYPATTTIVTTTKTATSTAPRIISVPVTKTGTFVPTVPQKKLLAPAPIISASLNRTLVVGSSGEDVRTLQKILNAKGYTVSLVGAGSKGHETTLFGGATLKAVQKFQCDKLKVCSGTPSTTGYGSAGIRTRAELLKK